MTVLTQLGKQPTPPQRRTAPRLVCRVDTDLAAMAAMREEWDALVGEAGGDIYFTYDWCRTWWRYYGRGRQLSILSFRQDNKLVGLVPLLVERLWMGPVPIRLAKMLGSDFTTVVLSPPVLPDCAVDIYTIVLETMLGQGRCEAAWFGPLAGNQPHRQALRQACGPQVQIVRDRDIGVHTIFQLPETFEQYLAGLDKSQRGNYRRDQRNLEKLHPLRLDTIEDVTQIQPEFDRFVALHQAQWTPQGMLGHFGDWPDAIAFNRDLARTMAAQGRLRLERLTAGQEPVAYDYSFRLGPRLFWRLPARRTGEPWDRLGLGRVCLVARIQAAIAAGIRQIEGGGGHYDYKVRLGATEYPLGSMLISNKGLAGLKAKMLCRRADLLNFAYYRAWFSRIAPRLPLPRRPLWRMWIRSHL
jgi:CelD/BcsL family acetyltransferase involved in cellulose biosynthesis